MCHHGTCQQLIQIRKTNLEALGHGLSDTRCVFTVDLQGVLADESSTRACPLRYERQSCTSILHSVTSASRLRCWACAAQACTSTTSAFSAFSNNSAALVQEAGGPLMSQNRSIYCVGGHCHVQLVSTTARRKALFMACSAQLGAVR